MEKASAVLREWIETKFEEYGRGEGQLIQCDGEQCMVCPQGYLLLHAGKSREFLKQQDYHAQLAPAAVVRVLQEHYGLSPGQIREIALTNDSTWWSDQETIEAIAEALEARNC